MPIYEFYCPQCHTIYSFWSKTINTEKSPLCPGCDKNCLERRVSSFAVISGGKAEGETPLDNLPIDESKIEQAMASLASEAGGIDEEDPKVAAQFMRKFSDMTGLKYGKSMEEALNRLEAGEDPEAIETELGDMLEGDELPFILPAQKSNSKAVLPPNRDETLYEM